METSGRIEAHLLRQWQHASAATVREIAALQEALRNAGTQSMGASSATLQRTRAELEELKSSASVKRFKRLQEELKEADAIIAALKLLSGLPEDAINEYIDKRAVSGERLYGASREQLLRENKILRAQLEQRLVTSKTSRLPPEPELASTAYALRPQSGNSSRGALGAQHPALGSLLQAAAALDAASKSYRPPVVRHVEVEVDDGSAARLREADASLQSLLLQKTAALRKLEKVSGEKFVMAQKLENALDEISDLRRTKAEMFMKDASVPWDAKALMAEEVQAREEVEVKLREAEGAQVALRGQLTEAQGQLGAATERLAAMEAALREKSEQVATLKELMLALRVSMQEANDVLVRDTQGALERAAAEQGRALAAAVDQVAATKEAAVRSSQTLDGLTAQQRAMAEELSRITLDNTSGMQMLRGELDATRSQLQAADAERRTLGRQVLAAGALSRVEDRRHQKLLKVIMSDLPERLAGQLTAEFKVLQEQTGSILAGLRGANNQLTQTLGAGAPGPYGTSTMPRLNAYADDSAAVVMLEQSRALRSQLHALLMHETGAA